MNRLIDMGIGFIAAVFVAAILWQVYKPTQAPVNAWTPAKEAKQVALVPKEEVEIPKIEVYKPEAKKKLKLDKKIQDDPNASVIAATVVKADDRPVTVVTIIDKETGKSSTIERREPYPWFALENRREIRLSHGWRDTKTMTRISGSWDFAQTKVAHWGINGSIDIDGQRYLGASVSGRF